MIRYAALLALFGVIALGCLQVFAGGRVLTVRSWVRLERIWSRDFPVATARPWLKDIEPLIARVGLLKPVRVEVTPGVSLLLDPFDDIARTILVSRQSLWGDHGRVIAFEPNPRTLEILGQNIEASQSRNVTVQPIACTDSETTLTFYDSTEGGNSGASSMAADNAGSAHRAFTVRGRPIDAVVDELGLSRVDVLKADVEGAELLVLRGAAGTLKRFHPRLVLEVVPRQLANMGTSVEELEAFVRGIGYNQVRQIDYKNREYWVRK